MRERATTDSTKKTMTKTKYKTADNLFLNQNTLIAATQSKDNS